MTMSPTRTTSSSSEIGLGRLPETLDLVPPVLGLEIRQVVGGLPRLVEREQQAQIVCDRRFNRPDHLVVFRHRVVASIGQSQCVP